MLTTVLALVKITTSVCVSRSESRCVQEESVLTRACLPSITATQELVVPRSMPTTAPRIASDLKHQQQQQLRDTAFNQHQTCLTEPLILTHSAVWTPPGESAGSVRSNKTKTLQRVNY